MDPMEQGLFEVLGVVPLGAPCSEARVWYVTKLWSFASSSVRWALVVGGALPLLLMCELEMCEDRVHGCNNDHVHPSSLLSIMCSNHPSIPLIRVKASLYPCMQFVLSRLGGVRDGKQVVGGKCRLHRTEN
jgi:hypothetical protein